MKRMLWVGAMEQSGSNYQHFDLVIIVFTLIFAWAMWRQVKQRPRNLFSLGFTLVSLLVFLYVDWIMVQGW